MESVPTLNTASSYNLFTVKSKKKLARITKQAAQITGTTQTQLSEAHSCSAGEQFASLKTPHVPFATRFSYSLQSTTGQNENLQENFCSYHNMHFKYSQTDTTLFEPLTKGNFLSL